MTAFVLDASVTMRWFFDAGAHPLADCILTDLSSMVSQAVVPLLWRYEVSAVLARAQIKGWAAAEDVTDFFKDLAALPIQLDQESSLRIFSDVHRLAVAFRLTSYDAAYLELAQRRGLPLATLDADLTSACANAGARVL